MPPAELLFFVGASVLYGVVMSAVELHYRRRPRWLPALWREAAREVGLASIHEFESAVTGYSGTLLVRLSEPGDEEGNGTRVEIAGPGLAPGLTLRPEDRSVFASRSPREIEVGDDEFDQEVSVQGLPAVALAVLDPSTRHAVRTLLRGPFQPRGHPPLRVTGRLDEGRLRVDVPQGGEKLPAVLRAALDLAGRLLVPQELAGRLASNLASEPKNGVRRTTLRTLAREFPEAEATRQALRAARDDPDAEVRLGAGIALGVEGRDVLLALAAGEEAEDATSARAVTALGASLTAENASELLKGALRARRLQTAKACLSLLGEHGSGAVATLAKVLLVEKSELGEAAAQALAATGDPAAEAPLLRALAEGTPELRRAAVAALGRVGTRDAVAPLREAESHDAALRGVARQAVAQIHSRLAGAAQGQLSLAGGESGRLSLTEDESGRLSLSDGTEG
jgi:hypothetical protein